jgi:signal peptidase II
MNKFPKKFLNKKPFFILGLIISVIGIVIDLYTKNLVFYFLHDFNEFNILKYNRFDITGFFSLNLVINKGISFGMFDGINNAKIIFAVLQGSIAVALMFWLWNCQKKYLAIAIGLIIGGAFGNVIDRVLNGGVTDFLDFYIGSYHWPAFNVADSIIFIGVAIILFDEFFIKKT